MKDSKTPSLRSYEKKHPDIAAWWTDNPFSFAVSLRNYASRYGDLTEKQQASAQKCADMDRQRREAKDSAPSEVFDTASLYRALDNARSRGAKAPKIRCMLLIDDLHEVQVVFKGVQEHIGDHVFVTVNGDYQGRLEGTSLNRRVQLCGSFEVDVIKQALASIEESAILFGRRTGSCSCCGRELTNEESIRLGIGPICRDKFFL